MSGPKVALAGATGNLGTPILKALLEANLPVVVLSRKGSSSASKLPKHANLSVTEVDYNSVPELTEALKGVEVVVSTFASEAVGAQNPLIDAAVAAGVKRFIPSEFGSNTTNPKTAELPTLAGKVATQKYLKQVSAQNPGFTYTIFINGPFLDWGLAVGFLVNPKEHTATVFNGGDVRTSASTLGDIAKGVVGVIHHQAETANRTVFVQSAIITQNALIQYTKEKDGKEWTTTPVLTEDVRLDGLKKLQAGTADASVFVGFLASAIWDSSYGQDFSSSLDNDLLGVKGLTEPELKALVQSFA